MSPRAPSVSSGNDTTAQDVEELEADMMSHHPCISKFLQHTAGLNTPSARRAHAGVILNLNGTSTLIIHGGKEQGGDLLSDLWSVALEPRSTSWKCDFCAGERALGEASNKRKKRKKRSGPLARKGHAAFAIPDPDRPMMVSLLPFLLQ